ncbi:MAG: hypothetical protein ACKOEM_14475 [Planctomycetia bacterium]
MPAPTISTTKEAVALPAATQTRNLLLFAGCVGMQYLAAPVLYVGSTHAALLDELGTSGSFANAPEVLYIAFLFTPLFVSAIFTDPRWLKPLLTLAYLLNALGVAVVAAAIACGCSANAIGITVLVQSIVSGITGSTAMALAWEALGRGVDESRRGATLALAYGCGPILAAIGSLGSQALLTGETLGLRLTAPPSFPGNFGAVFAAATVPIVVAAVFGSLFVLPAVQPAAAASAAEERPGFLRSLAGFFGDPLLRRTAIAAVLVYASTMAVANLTLHTSVSMGEQPSDRVMYLLAIRFATKAVAGLLLGLLLAKTFPLAGMLATASLLFVVPLYATVATGVAYVVTFQIYGAGELFGVYTPNYILSASRRRDLRRNLACNSLLPAMAAPFGLLFGGIADVVAASYGRGAGYRASFLACAVIVGAGLAVALTLPRRPRPADE